ncbi:hypothetical protein N7456_012285 [Penicillium angulare]|uniref:Uncharacterized protein n=1 Tax=Penicillium angulare TaxID=116970 RepID=A0A9W9EVH6_9EURO|nr:hypothetical protein N7456_012285 [Penicillium angulare]
MPVDLAPISPCHTASFELEAYHEDQDHLVHGKPEPDLRSQTFIYHLPDEKWWIKVTFKGSFPFSKSTRKRERREKYREFIKLIDYRSLPLLKDTVAEVLLDEETKTTSHTLDVQNVPYPSLCAMVYVMCE